MELRAIAEQVLGSTDLELKLADWALPWTDSHPGTPVRWPEPARPANLQFAPRKTAPAMPALSAMSDPRLRAVAHHIMANHELQALEVMAWTLLAFPDAPAEFRMGLARVMADEQRHTQMHRVCCRRLGLEFGELPVNCYIWKKALQFGSVLDYLCGLPLTFEGRNLDHTLEFEDAFRLAGDPKSAAVMRRIHEDEIEHVAFGYRWLQQLKPADRSTWETYCGHLQWPLKAEKSIGDEFHVTPRRAAGLSEEFVDRLSQLAQQSHIPCITDDPLLR
jgi:uncharacterized ferritin-like protein (DUF455 family)